MKELVAIKNFYLNLKLYESGLYFLQIGDIGRSKIKEVYDNKSFVREIHRKCNISRFLFTKRSVIVPVSLDEI